MALRKLLTLPAMAFSCSAGYALGGGDLGSLFPFREVGGGGGDGAVSAQLAALSLAVAALERERNSQGSTIILDRKSGNSTGGSITLLGMFSTTLGVAAFGYCRWNGISMSDLAYVTAKEFKKGSASLSKSVKSVRAAVTRMRRELLERISGVERTVKACGAHTDARVAAEGAAIRAEIAAVDGSHQALRDMVENISENLDTVEQQTRYSSEGIHLLCSVLDREIMAAGPGRNRKKHLGEGSARALTQLKAHAAECVAPTATMGGGRGGGGAAAAEADDSGGGNDDGKFFLPQRRSRIKGQQFLLEEAVPQMPGMVPEVEEEGEEQDLEEDQPPLDFTRRASVHKRGVSNSPMMSLRTRVRRSPGEARALNSP